MLVTTDRPISLTEVRLPAIAPIPEAVPATAKAEPSSEGASEHDQESFSQSKRRDSGKVDQAIHRFLENIGGKNSELAISIDKETQRIVIKVLNSETKKVIKQIPSEDLLGLAEDLQKTGAGIFDQTA
ncbi:MAG: flagellar protein FlaG [Acidobacteria bacterium]|nr:flagellar protein FlaG [Acidobacteriota bacterium]